MKCLKTTFVFVLLLCQFCARAQNWQTVGGGYMDSTLWVRNLMVDSNILVASGQVLSYQRFLKYDNSTWDTLGGLHGGLSIQTVKYRGSYYAVNYNNPNGFYSGIGILVNNIWQPFAETNNSCIGIFVLDTSIYVMGKFDSISGIAARGIARFDGTNWHAIGNAPLNSGSGSYCATLYQGHLYVGGGFHNSNSFHCLAKWDGTQWYNFGTAFTGFLDGVNCFAEFNGDLYVGGYFTTASGSPGNMIARWDGNTWSQVGGGITGGQLFTMKVYNNELWVGGQFSSAGGVSTPYIAKYDGTDWCNVGDFDNSVSAIEVFNGELYVGGGFWVIDGDSVTKVVKWVGGNNTGQCGHLTTDIIENESLPTVSVFPNPAKSSVTFQVTSPTIPFDITIFNQLGQQVFSKLNNSGSVEVQIHQLTPGMYFYSLFNSVGVFETGKLIVQ
ncbi:MAG: T9SS type A sorting domain-containing protein [Bacteroidia bacterium]|jgi:hypothetical protein|nr:T9SS type A sorting domain-containing protein [Bacteroidia bacterium]